MKKTLILLAVAITLLVMVGGQPVCAQERASVNVKSSEVVTGVVIVDIVRDGKLFELQCNMGSAHCSTLKSGSYVMVELPKNFGMYDCNNVEIYREDGDNRERAEPLGEYCLIEK